MGRKRVLAACLLLLAAVLVLLVASARRADLGAPAPQQTDVPASAAQPAASSTDASPSRRSAADDRDVALTDGARNGDDAPQHVVLAVVWPDGRPAPNAEVRYWPPRSAAQRSADEAVIAAKHDFEAALRATGRTVATDAEGRVEFVADAVSWFCARSGDGYGELGVSQNELQSWIVLRRDAALRVEIVDDRGQPCAGIGVDAECKCVPRSPGGPVIAYFELPPTDAQGRTSWPHIQAKVPPPGDEALEWSMELRCPGNHLASSRRAVAPGEWLSQAPIRIVVPSGGDVIVEVVDAAGQPWHEPPILVDDERGIDCSPTSQDHATYCFRQVPLGRRWRMTVVADRGADSRDLKFVSQDLLGPTTFDEPVRARFVVPRVVWTLTGRLVRANGRPFEVRKARFHATAVGDERTSVEVEHVVVGGGQKLWLWLRTPVAAQLVDATFHVECDVPRAEFDVAVPEPIRDHHQHLGDIVVPAPADEMDLAIVEARLFGASVTAAAYPRLFEGVGDRKRPLPTARQNDGPAMVLRGERPAGELWLACNHAAALPTMRRIEPGARVLVELEPSAHLCVRLVYGCVPDRLLSARLLPLDEPGEPVQASCFNSTLEWGPVRPARYRMIVAIDARDVFEAELPPLVPGPNFWPAGAPLDLRGRVRLLHADVCDPDGKRLDAEQHGVRWRTVPAGAQELQEGSAHDWRSDRLIVLDEAPCDVLFAATNRVPVRVPLPARDFRVTLVPYTMLQLQAAGVATTVVLDDFDDGFSDPLLRAAERDLATLSPPAGDFALDPGTPTEIPLPPGARFTLRTVRDGVRGPPQPVVVGAVGPQVVVVQ